MTAWHVDGGFGLDNLRRVETTPAAPRRGEVRLRMHAVALNYRDLLMVEGAYDPRQPLPLVPCSDGVGVVEAVGEGVTTVQVGERVCPIFAEAWLEGQPTRAMLRSTRGGPLPGTLQTHLVLPAAACVRPPTHLSDEEAATLPCAAVTAWRALDAGAVGPGSTVLTLGTGGVSLFALQLARLRGARVAITSSSDQKLETAAALGADLCVNYSSDPAWGKTVGRWAGEGVDCVVELGGAGTLQQSLAAVRAGGTLALIGVLAGAVAKVPLTRILMRGIRIQGIMVGHRADFMALNEALTAHPEVRPVVQRMFSMDEAPEALRYLKSQRHLGKVVVRVA